MARMTSRLDYCIHQPHSMQACTPPANLWCTMLHVLIEHWMTANCDRHSHADQQDPMIYVLLRNMQGLPFKSTNSVLPHLNISLIYRHTVRLTCAYQLFTTPTPIMKQPIPLCRSAQMAVRIII